jgi:hypothetical protein
MALCRGKFRTDTAPPCEFYSIEVFMIVSRGLFVILIILGLAGCSTMNQSECLQADWSMIGMEDGAKGQPISRIGEHRKACAEYGVTPDMEQYRIGHTTGLRQFCTESNGYQIGKRGGPYSTVCPPELEESFLIGYNVGRQLFTSAQEVRQATNAIKLKKSALKQLQDQIVTKEKRLISDKTSETTRRRLLEEIRDDEARAAVLEDEIFTLEVVKFDKQFEYDELMNASPY